MSYKSFFTVPKKINVFLIVTPHDVHDVHVQSMH